MRRVRYGFDAWEVVVEMFSWVERERRVEWADLLVRKKGVMVGGCVCGGSGVSVVMAVLDSNVCRTA